ncbi:MAG: IS1595 family transposase [Halobacteriales archaeon]
MIPLKVFVSEASAADLLRQVRWRDGVYCPHCRSDSVIKYGSYRVFQRYRCKDCDQTFNDKTGTIFAYSKIALRLWFVAVYSFLRFRSSVRQLDAELAVSYRSMHQLIKRVCRSLDCRVPNFGDVIEIDEVYVTAGLKGRERDQASRSRALSQRGRGTYDSDKVPVLIVTDRQSGNSYTIPAKHADSSTIKLILGVEDYTEDDPLTVCTDEFTTYDFLDEDDRFIHKVVTHSEGEYATEDGDVHVNTCESQGSLLRSWLSSHRGVSKDRLTPYLRAFDLRRQIRRKPGKEALKEIIQAML